MANFGKQTQYAESEVAIYGADTLKWTKRGTYAITYILTTSFSYSHVPAPGHNVPPHTLIPSCSMYSLIVFLADYFQII